MRRNTEESKTITHKRSLPAVTLIMLPLLFLPLSLLPLLLIHLLFTRFPYSTARPSRKHETPQQERESEELPSGLRRELMPTHVAIILDGNRRWAHQPGLMTCQGHEAGARRLLDLAMLCFKWGIHTFSAFAFSTENWGRPKDEVDYLMDAFERFLISETSTLKREGIRISIIGNTTRIPESLLAAKEEAEEATRVGSRYHIIFAIDYSGRSDITQACKRISQKAQDGLIQAEDIDDSMVEQALLTNGIPHPDLLIRTSGEQRVSNFYLWQSAYTELFFSPALWPDFDKDELAEALASYQRRERRFGRRL